MVQLSLEFLYRLGQGHLRLLVWRTILHQPALLLDSDKIGIYTRLWVKSGRLQACDTGVSVGKDVDLFDHAVEPSGPATPRM